MIMYGVKSFTAILPNLLVLFRFLLAVLTWAALFIGWPIYGMILYTIGIATDAVDGRLARHFRATTPFGGSMDSAADKTLVIAALLGLARQNPLLIALAFAFAAREFPTFGIRSIRTRDGTQCAKVNDQYGRLRFLALHAGILFMISAAWYPFLWAIGFWTAVAATLLSYITLYLYLKRDFQNIRKAFVSDRDECDQQKDTPDSAPSQILGSKDLKPVVGKQDTGVEGRKSSSSPEKV